MATFIQPDVTSAKKEGIIRNVAVGFILRLKVKRTIVAVAVQMELVSVYVER